LASSAFLIYLDPEHGINKVITLIAAHIGSAILGMLSFILLGSGYFSAGLAMVLAIVLERVAT
jgi:hypothetical protein